MYTGDETLKLITKDNSAVQVHIVILFPLTLMVLHLNFEWKYCFLLSFLLCEPTLPIFYISNIQGLKRFQKNILKEIVFNQKYESMAVHFVL